MRDIQNVFLGADGLCFNNPDRTYEIERWAVGEETCYDGPDSNGRGRPFSTDSSFGCAHCEGEELTVSCGPSRGTPFFQNLTQQSVAIVLYEGLVS